MVRLSNLRGAARGAPALAPLILAFACSENTDYFGDDVQGTGGRAGAAGSSSGSGGSGLSGGGQGGTEQGKAGSSAGGAGSGSGGGGGSAVAGTGNTTNTGGTGNGGAAGSSGDAGEPSLAGEGGGFAVGGSAGEGGAGVAGEGGAAAAGGSGGTAGTGGVSGSSGSEAGGSAGAGSGGGGTSGAGAGGSAGGGNGGAGSGGTAGTGGCTSNPERCDGVNNNCTGGIDEDNACPSGCTGATENGHVYVLCYQSAMSSRVTWAEAASRCAGSLSTAAGVTLELARVESPDENEFLVEWIEDRNLQSGIWMGANDRDVDDSWSWGTGNARVVFFKDDMNGGDAVDDRFNDWGTNPPRPNGDTAMDPTEDCGHFDANISWRWNDAPCEAQPMPGYVCEQVD